MDYHGFSVRDYLVVDKLPISKDSAVLEIGVGTAGTVQLLDGKIKAYCGVDISSELIDYLNLKYSEKPKKSNIEFRVIDVNRAGTHLGLRFNLIFSIDTLQFINPDAFFSFIAEHIQPSGRVLVTFPNGNKLHHQGCTWFDTKNDLKRCIDSSRLKIDSLEEVKKTIFHRIIELIFWCLPRRLLKLRGGTSRAMFTSTAAFTIMKNKSIKSRIFAYYAFWVTKFATLFPLFKYVRISNESLVNKTLLVMLTGL